MRNFSEFVVFIEARRAMPFAWGKTANDCASFAGGGVAALTGKNPLDGLPDWTNEEEALAVIASFGSLEAAVDTVMTKKPIGLAKRGDVALIEIDGTASLSLIDAGNLWAPGACRLMSVPRAKMKKAWGAE